MQVASCLTSRASCFGVGEITGRDFFGFLLRSCFGSQIRLEESRKEHASLLESTRQLRRSLEELQDQKAELEAQVDLLQTRSQRLQKHIRSVHDKLPLIQKDLPCAPNRDLSNPAWTPPVAPSCLYADPRSSGILMAVLLPVGGMEALGSVSRPVNNSLCQFVPWPLLVRFSYLSSQRLSCEVNKMPGEGR